MSRPRRCLPACVLLVASMACACGKKGPPLAPLRLVPARVTDLGARRLGSAVRLTLTIPVQNTDGSQPADLTYLEVLALTLPAKSRSPSTEELLGKATTVARLEVRPPARDDGRTTPATVDADPRPAQGEVARVTESLTPAALVPVMLPPLESRPGGPGAATAAPMANAAARPGQAPAAADPSAPSPLEAGASPRTRSAPPPGAPSRLYVVRGVSRKGRAGPLSGRSSVSLAPAPGPPDGLTIDYTAVAIEVAWEPPALPTEPTSVGATEPTAPSYNVYRASIDPGESLGDVPINAQPLAEPRFEEPLDAFDEEQCYAVRTVQTVDSLAVESDPSPRVCVTPRDTFPPAAPSGLGAVAGPGVVSLIWDAGGEPDLAGYLVLRGEAPDATLRPLTPTPIRETTYRDTDVRPGVRYLYAVVAVDTATPPNVSVQSTRVEETAR